MLDCVKHRCGGGNKVPVFQRTKNVTAPNRDCRKEMNVFKRRQTHQCISCPGPQLRAPPGCQMLPLVSTECVFVSLYLCCCFFPPLLTSFISARLSPSLLNYKRGHGSSCCELVKAPKCSNNANNV